MSTEYDTIDHAWGSLAGDVLMDGDVVESRAGKTKELLASTSASSVRCSASSRTPCAR